MKALNIFVALCIGIGVIIAVGIASQLLPYVIFFAVAYFIGQIVLTNLRRKR